MNLATAVAVRENNALALTQPVTLFLATTIQFRQVPFLEMLIISMCHLENNMNSSMVYSSSYSC